VNEAAVAIGKLCSDDDCDMLITRLRKAPLDLMTSGLDAILFRPSPLTERALIKIIGQIHDLGTPDADKYLSDALRRWPASGSPLVKRSLLAASGK
jgi:hypothetical protein